MKVIKTAQFSDAKKPSNRLDRKTMRLVNTELDKAGFGGRVSFPRVNDAVRKIEEIISKFGISIRDGQDAYVHDNDVAMNTGMSHAKDGRKTLSLVLNGQDIINAKLWYTWYHKGEVNGNDQFEVISAIS